MHKTWAIKAKRENEQEVSVEIDDAPLGVVTMEYEGDAPKSFIHPDKIRLFFATFMAPQKAADFLEELAGELRKLMKP